MFVAVTAAIAATLGHQTLAFTHLHSSNAMPRITLKMSNEAKTQNADFFGPLKQIFGGTENLFGQSSISQEMKAIDEEIDDCKIILNKAVETKSEDPESVLSALQSLEKLMRKKCKVDESASNEILSKLDGDWRLIFTTGTVDTQKKLGAKINYFPIKAMQSFRPMTSPMEIENGIYLGDFNLIKFFGDFEFNPKSRKLEFDFDKISVLGLMINLGKGDAAKVREKKM